MGCCKCCCRGMVAQRLPTHPCTHGKPGCLTEAPCRAILRPSAQGTGQLENVGLADWTAPTINSWRHSIWVGVWDPWIVVFKVRPLCLTHTTGKALFLAHKGAAHNETVRQSRLEATAELNDQKN